MSSCVGSETWLGPEAGTEARVGVLRPRKYALILHGCHLACQSCFGAPETLPLPARSPVCSRPLSHPLCIDIHLVGRAVSRRFHNVPQCPTRACGSSSQFAQQLPARRHPSSSTQRANHNPSVCLGRWITRCQSARLCGVTGVAAAELMHGPP